MPDLDAVITPPRLVRRRAWECAFVLSEEYLDRVLDDRGSTNARHVLRSGPDRVSWRQAGAMFRLFNRLVGRRK